MALDFIPRGESEFFAFATTFVGAAATYAETLGIPSAMVASLQAKLAVYKTAYEASESANAGRLDRRDRKVKRKALTDDIRKTKNAWIDPNPSGAVTPEIRGAFGLPEPDESRTDEPDPTEEVEFSLRHGEYGQVVIVHGARPENYNGALALYKVVPPGAPAPVLAELLNSRLLTKTHEIMEFPDTEIGHTLYITLVWQNSKGRRGPAAQVRNIVIS